MTKVRLKAEKKIKRFINRASSDKLLEIMDRENRDHTIADRLMAQS